MRGSGDPPTGADPADAVFGPRETAAAPHPPAPAPRRIAVVTPCYNAPEDLTRLLADLARLEPPALPPADEPNPPEPGSLRVLVVDNASAQPLDRVEIPTGLEVDFLRLSENRGGSGGYNAGMAHAIARGARAGRRPEFIWLLDSDARPRPDALNGLVRALEEHPGMALVGSAIADPDTGELFEIGGRLDRATGCYRPAFDARHPPPGRVAEATYVAACSLLVRTGAVVRAGLMPDVFLNGDDVEWCVRLGRRTGGRIGVTTDSVVSHPRFARAGQTWIRYYMARNAFAPLSAIGAGPRLRCARALRELPRAIAQTLIQRRDLAELHLRGLADAAAGRTEGSGHAAIEDAGFEPFHAFERLPELLTADAPRARRTIHRAWIDPTLRLPPDAADALERALVSIGLEGGSVRRGSPNAPPAHGSRSLAGGLWRLVRGPHTPVAVIAAHARPPTWARGRVQIQVAPNGLVVRRFSRARLLAGLIGVSVRGLWLSLRLLLRDPIREPERRLPRIDAPADPEPAKPTQAAPIPATARGR